MCVIKLPPLTKSHNQNDCMESHSDSFLASHANSHPGQVVICHVPYFHSNSILRGLVYNIGHVMIENMTWPWFSILALQLEPGIQLF